MEKKKDNVAMEKAAVAYHVYKRAYRNNKSLNC